MRLPLDYILKRLVIFFIIIWATASLNFIIPRLAPGDPIGAMVSRMSMQGASTAGSAELISYYREVFGLDDPLGVQYLKYLQATFGLDLGYSLTNFPTSVIDIIGRALPWTVGLLLTTTILSFVIGSLIGALIVWRQSAYLSRLLAGPLIVLAAIPYYLLAILLLYLLAFWLKILPSGGTSTVGGSRDLNLAYILDVAYHSLLPALSIILTSIGGWMLGMRGLMVNVVGADYLMLAQAKGLRDRRIFLRYAMRNAILPQVTSLAISLGHVVAGATLVEIIFSYPGVGYQLYRAIGNSDYGLIQGITFILVLSVAVAILILDLVYPLLDPRITYGRK